MDHKIILDLHSYIQLNKGIGQPETLTTTDIHTKTSYNRSVTESITLQFSSKILILKQNKGTLGKS